MFVSVIYRLSPKCNVSRVPVPSGGGGERRPFDAAKNSLRYFTDKLFGDLKDESGKVPVSKLYEGLQEAGIRQTDPRLSESMRKISQLQREGRTTTANNGGIMLDKVHFRESVKENAALIKKAFTSDFVIPEFGRFTDIIDDMYRSCQSNTDGKVASYIPQLFRYKPENWGVALCTVDGQRHAIGDTDVFFSLQSCSKPLTYVVGLNELGHNVVHQYIGHEPSGQQFNHIKLSDENRPHNPMINSGAILMASLIKNDLCLADRFDYMYQQLKRLAGGEYIGFNNSVFLSERETADRNFAIGYLLKENKCFPSGVNLTEVMDFYFQLCSIDITCETGAVMAATLANGGVCPITDEQLLSANSVRDTLSLMHSCGMYNYSGEFAFKVGLPAKSGVSGAILLVVPNVMGMCLWSPPLDVNGNTVRGIQFCQELVKMFNFHHYDTIKHSLQRIDPRRTDLDRHSHEVMNLLFGAATGDVTYTLRRMALSGVDMGKSDYDGRTGLHLASAEGHLDTVVFLLEKCDVVHDPKDRWNHTPLDDAVRFKHPKIADYLRAYALKKQQTSPPEKPWLPTSPMTNGRPGSDSTPSSSPRR
ncbi:Glutaminase kidney [Lamellibrachia satsuma]|nr:Glutaminase kidney [Lamellibrachia satsuma]